MIALSWNCQGLGHPQAIPTIKELVQAHRPLVIFLFKTLAHENKVEEVKRVVAFEGMFVVDQIGRNGGVCALWCEANLCSVIGFSCNHIDLEVVESDNCKWWLTSFYGFPERQNRRVSWNLLQNLHALSNAPWCVIGDFNDMLHPDDQKGRVEHPNWLFSGFRDAILDCDLHEIPLQGYPFTCCRSKGSPNGVEEHIDRAFVFPSWQQRFLNALLTSLVASISDHTRLLLETCISAPRTVRRQFRFENNWLNESDLKEVVNNSWDFSYGSDLSSCLNCCASNLENWGREHFQKLCADVKQCKERLFLLQTRDDCASIVEFENTRVKLARLLMQEESYWRQRAKAHWLKDRDSNTKFFHARTLARRKKNQITSLTDDRLVCRDDIGGLCSVV